MLAKYISSIKDNIFYARGILNKRHAYKGAHFLEVHITNSCNINCIGCFYHSSRKPDRFNQAWRRQCIKADDFFRIIDEAQQMKVKNIVFSGNGEPFMHPDIMEFIKYIKQKKMNCMVVTNGILINEDILDELSLLKLNSIVLSLWDCNENRYGELKPDHKDELNAIKQWLRIHNKKKLSFPKITLIYLINNRNYNCIDEMFEFAQENNIRKVIFRLFKVYEDTTKDFMMTPEQIVIAIQQLKRMTKKTKKKTITNSKDFCRFLEGLNIKGHMYYNNFLRNMPCYIGWLYMIVLIEGDVIPCCGCRRYILGNIYKDKLTDIWGSKKYELFRYQTLLNKNIEVFDDCHCGDLCSHYQINLKLNNYFGRLIKI